MTIGSLRTVIVCTFTITLFVGTPPSAEASTVPGSWPMWRANPQHTAYQPLAGRISNPRVRWRYSLGGNLNESMVCSAITGETFLVYSEPGHIRAVDFSGHHVWSARRNGDSKILGCPSMFGGDTQVLVASAGYSNSSMALLDLRTGAQLWNSGTTSGAIGSVKIADLDGDHRPELLWAPAATADLFAMRVVDKELKPWWHRTIRDYVSDPYSYSPIIVDDLQGDGKKEVILTGARSSIPIIVFDGLTGAELKRATYTVDDGGTHSYESGGTGQLLTTVQGESGAARRIVTVSSYGSDAYYMFQGAISASLDTLHLPAIYDSYPTGLRYAATPVIPVNGIPTLIASHYDPEAHRHDLELVDPISLKLLASKPDFAVRDAVSTPSGSVLIGVRGAQTEDIVDPQTVVALKTDGTLREMWTLEGAKFQLVPKRDVDSPTITNAADTPVILTRGSGRKEVLLRSEAELALVDVETGAISARLKTSDRVATAYAGDESHFRVVLHDGGGKVTLLNSSLTAMATAQVGGYNRSPSSNGHTSELAIILPRSRTKGPTIVAVDSQNRLLQITPVRSSRHRGSMSRLIFDSKSNQELLSMVDPHSGENVLFVRSGIYSVPSLLAVDLAGNVRWRHDLGANMMMPTGINMGKFNDSGCPGIVFASEATRVFTQQTFALDSCSGKSLWSSALGPFWDATYATGDIDHDGYDDVAFNLHIQKARVLSGRNGQLLSNYAVLPEYEQLGLIDYNGSLLLFDANGDGSVDLLNGDDNAHLALLHPLPSAESPGDTEVVWSLPQPAIDSQRGSMPAVAPMPDGSRVVGVANTLGWFEAHASSDGSLLWRRRFADPESNEATSFSSVAACDINGDGTPEFVVGTSSGMLYALNAQTGGTVWSIDLDSPVGDPIIGDVEGDGTSEILVPAADGYLYEITGAP